MNPFALVFMPGGRISRLPYFLAGMAVMFVTFFVTIVLVATTIGAAAFSHGDARASSVAAVMIAVVVGLFLLAAYVYAVINLMVKRLHDIGYSGLHVIWIFGLNLVGSTFNALHSPLGTVIYGLSVLASMGVGLWLLFMPGEPVYNDYGEIFS